MTFYELEKACKKRRLRRLFFFSFMALFLGVIAVLALSFKKSEKVKKRVIEVNKSKVKVEKRVKEVEKNITIKKVEKKPPKPNKKVENKKVEVKLEVEKEVFLKPIVEIPTAVKNNGKNEAPIKSVKKEKKIEKEEVNNSISEPQKNLIVTETINYDSALKKAEQFFKEGKYTEAIKWAKNANLQDPTKPESWIITAKSLSKIGHSEKAIEILKTYLKYYKDKRVKEVLNEITHNSVN